jgi:hypothetical protein
MIKPELNEPKMESNERMFKGYTYVVHADPDKPGSVYVSVRTERVSEFKARCTNVTAVHKCDMVGRCIAVKKVTKVRK